MRATGYARRRLLIVDDDARFGESATAVLTKAGFIAHFHRGPFGTLGAIRGSGCQVVLMDVDMPGLDGPMLVRMIRGSFGPGLRVLLCSNMSEGTLSRLAFACRADGALPKTAFAGDIASRLEEALGEGARRVVAR
ncbi:response regulator [Polyangium aurulentum]|uniref:response regulator n=1 Tax=Polyangium aurulentum TaxID=2567896 RepID=UPI0010ADB7FE|nr:response regulator [Polyangium aurulentum]UQA60710.1 response regulator [Polyangium aurulentum]